MGIVFGFNGQVRADQRAGPAPRTVPLNVQYLTDHVGNPSCRSGEGGAPLGLDHSLDKDRGFYGIDRADRCTTAAAGTPVFSPLDDVGELFECEFVVLV